MEGREIFYTDLSAIVKEEISDTISKDFWLKVSYETPDYKGVALFAADSCEPKPITLQLNAKGWYKIYLCIGEITGNDLLQVSLSKDKGMTMIRPSHLSVVDGTASWARFDFAEEVFYRAADLTGQDLIINKPSYGTIFSSSLYYIRLVPMTDKEVEEYKNPKNTGRMAYHFDNDYINQCDHQTAEDYLGKINMLHAGNADLLIHECNTWVENLTQNSPNYFAAKGIEKRKHYAKHFNEVSNLILERAHSYGMKVLTGCRVEAGSSLFPATHRVKEGAAYGEKGMNLRTREGKYLAAGSYAYPLVREQVIESILARMPENWDGVSIFLHRGILVGFEEPICKYVQEKYGVDARKLPYGDERLTEALCIPMTEFFRELKTALEKRAKQAGKEKYIVNIVGLFSKENCKEFGYDCETWAKEGLIDSVCQGLMGYKENLEDILGENGLIDLEKYREAQKTRHVFIRYFDAHKNVVLPALPAWFELSKKYGIDFYATMPWEHPRHDQQIDMAKTLYEAGAEKLFVWNANHSATKPATIQAIKDCGDKEKIFGENNTTYRKLVRIYSLGINDISTFCVNWLG